MELDVEKGEHRDRGGRQLRPLAPRVLLQEVASSASALGGALAQYAATSIPNVGAAVSFYGGFKKVPLNWRS